MPAQNTTSYFIKIVATSFKDILFLPVWWYSLGFWHFILFLKNLLVSLERRLAFFIWLKNIFVPMYGQKDWQGILISILVRIVQVTGRGFILLIIFLVFLALIVAWLVLPIVLLREIWWQLSLLD